MMAAEKKEINMGGGEVGWLFNDTARSKRCQLQMFLTQWENKSPWGSS